MTTTTAAAIPWSIPVALANVPESGLHIDATADEAVRAAIARLAGVDALPRLEASFDIARWGRAGLHVTGRVRAGVAQTCVVTLEPVENAIDEPVDLLFAPPGSGGVAAAIEAAPAAPAEPGELVVHPEEADPPEELVDGRADLGRVAVEFLLLAIDPYPKKPGAVFEAPAAAAAPDSPFAALAALKKDGTEKT